MARAPILGFDRHGKQFLRAELARREQPQPAEERLAAEEALEDVVRSNCPARVLRVRQLSGRLRRLPRERRVHLVAPEEFVREVPHDGLRV